MKRIVRSEGTDRRRSRIKRIADRDRAGNICPKERGEEALMLPCADLTCPCRIIKKK